jgi:hypothetical protein
MQIIQGCIDELAARFSNLLNYAQSDVSSMVASQVKNKKFSYR